MEKRNVGRLIVDDSLLLELLGYPRGELRCIGESEEYLDRHVFVIEHPDMPVVDKPGELLQNIHPEYECFNVMRRITNG